MPWHPALTPLRDALADLYPSEAAARQAAADAQLSPRRIAFGPVAVDTWHSILEEAEKQGQVPDILCVALAAFPGRADLLEARRAFPAAPRDSVAQAVAARPPVLTTAVTRPPAAQEAPMPDAPITLFYSYAHADEALRDELDKHLKLLQRQGVISGWHDRRIDAGEEWEEEIKQHLQEARIILLLVSADFLASDYCWDVEMDTAIRRHQARTARVVPVILRPCDWHSAPFGVLQALPRDGRAVTTWPNRDEAFTDIAQGLRRVAEALRHP